MAISINQLKSGLTILVEGTVYMVIEVQHVKPGKGAGFVRSKLKNMENGYVTERTFKSDEEIEEAFVEGKKLQYLYQADGLYHFMDQENFEEISLSKDVLDDKVKFLKDNLEVNAYYYKGKALDINLPNFINVKITNTEPGIKGDTAKSGTKPAEIETGAIIQVPLFITTGDIIKVDTRSGEYIERASL